MEYGTKMVPTDSALRFQHYNVWQQYLMNNILPVQPAFTSKYYSVNWANLDGFEWTQLVNFKLRGDYGKKKKK